MPADERGALSCFKAYDVRGRLGDELNEAIAGRVARAFASELSAQTVVLGRDPRASSEALARSVAEALAAQGVEVLDLGLCGTEEVYFGTDHAGADGGICVTASHNPMDYNGLKMVAAGSAPLSEAQFSKVRARAEENRFAALKPGGRIRTVDFRAAYVDRVMSFVDPASLGPFHLLVNAGNGAAGPTFDALITGLNGAGAQIKVTRLHHAPDGTFPNGIPNPLLPEQHPVTGQAVVAAGADMGIAWDGDFDRCFLFDHTGAFVPGEYVVGLLAEAFLDQNPGASIVHDPRVVWNTKDIVARLGGRAIESRTGHAFVKAVMRDTGAVYGGEMSAHHYFKRFMACDSGMIPWVMVLGLLARRDKSLADILAARRAAFPSSGEINFRVKDAVAAMARVEQALAGEALSRDDTDGLSLEFATWRLNLRRSNTEPLLRLNCEARGAQEVLRQAIERVTALIA
ncbi:MAG: phosphomannomutase [Maritimibacter sp.]